MLFCKPSEIKANPEQMIVNIPDNFSFLDCSSSTANSDLCNSNSTGFSVEGEGLISFEEVFEPDCVRVVFIVVEVVVD